MLIKVGNFEFIEYENQHGRECEIECEDNDLLGLIHEKIKEKEAYQNTVLNY